MPVEQTGIPCNPNSENYAGSFDDWTAGKGTRDGLKERERG